MIGWWAFARPGDWLVIVLAAVATGATLPLAWRPSIGEKVVVRRAGEVFAEADLARNRRFDVPGPLGMTTIVIDRQRVRVVADPGPRQYCVRQGWLQRAGEIAICAPNQVSVEVLGSRPVYDSLAY